MSSNTCLVITGLIQEDYIPFLIQSYGNMKNKIVSTWLNQDESLIEMLRLNGFIIV
jgi:hypothetical protein